METEIIEREFNVRDDLVYSIAYIYTIHGKSIILFLMLVEGLSSFRAAGHDVNGFMSGGGAAAITTL